MKKNKKLIMGVASLALIATTSLAIFTDRATGTFEGTTANLKLSEVIDTTGSLANIAPGQSRDLKVSTKYTGTVDGKARLIITDKGTDKGKLKAVGANEGFVLKHDGTEVTVPADGYKINLGTVSNGAELKAPLALELKLNSKNEYQGAKASLSYEFQVMQDYGTEWTKVDDKIISIEGQ